MTGLCREDRPGGGRGDCRGRLGWLQECDCKISPTPAKNVSFRVVGTTKYSEQKHNPKEKGFKLKEYSRLKSHESLSEYDSKTGITFVLALRPIGAVAWESPFELITTEPERVRRPEYSVLPPEPPSENA